MRKLPSELREEPEDLPSEPKEALFPPFAAVAVAVGNPPFAVKMESFNVLGLLTGP